MNEDLKNTMFDTTFDEYGRWTNSEISRREPLVLFDGLTVPVSSLTPVRSPYSFLAQMEVALEPVARAFNHSIRLMVDEDCACRYCQRQERLDLLSIASRRKGYG